MKLFLSSLGIPEPRALMDLVGVKGTVKVASIRDAWGPYGLDRQKEFDGYATAQLQSINAEHSVVNLADYENDQSGLMNALSGFDLIWIHGGNTFVLNYSIQKSGFGNVIRKLLDEGIAFGGDSAGAVIACPTLHGIELVDDSSVAPEVLYNGLNLISFGIIPHWGLKKYAGIMSEAEKRMKQHVNRVIRLADTDFIVVNDNTVTLHRENKIIPI